MVADEYDVASAEARAGRRGLLDSGPHAPERERRSERAEDGAGDRLEEGDEQQDCPHC